MQGFIKDEVEYIPLDCPCPNDIEMGKPTQSGLFWTHRNNECGGNLFLGDNSYIYCEKCGQSEIVFKCRFMCPNCSKVHSRMISFGHGISIYNSLPFFGEVCTKGGVRFMRKLTATMNEWLDNKPNNNI